MFYYKFIHSRNADVFSLLQKQGKSITHSIELVVSYLKVLSKIFCDQNIYNLQIWQYSNNKRKKHFNLLTICIVTITAVLYTNITNTLLKLQVSKTGNDAKWTGAVTTGFLSKTIPYGLNLKYILL